MVTRWTTGLLGLAVASLVAAGQAFAEDGDAVGAPLSLEGCLNAALANNPGVEAARQQAAAAEAGLRQSRATYYPMVRAGSTYSRTDNPPQAFMSTLNQRTLSFDGDFNHPDDTENLRMSLEAGYRLFDGGRRRLDRAAASSAADASDAAWRASRSDLRLQITRTYYQVLQAGAFVQVQTNALLSLDRSLDVARQRLAAGSAMRADVLNLEVRQAEAREDLLRASNAVTLAVAALNAGIGREVVTAEGLLAPTDSVQAPLLSSTVAEVEQRPEFEAAQAAARAQRQSWQRARRDFVPNVNAFGSMDWDSDVSVDFERSTIVGLRADWDVFTGFAHEESAARAKAQWRAAQALAEQARSQLELELKSARLMAQEAWGRLGVARGATGAAEEARRLTREQYEAGSAGVADLLNAEAAASGAQARAVAAEFDYRVAMASVARAQGDWDRPTAGGTEPTAAE